MDKTQIKKLETLVIKEITRIKGLKDSNNQEMQQTPFKDDYMVKLDVDLKEYNGILENLKGLYQGYK